MITIRPSQDRGQVETNWLNSKHSFSFGHYHDPNHMGFGPLRVINEDAIDCDKGFGKHPHDNMEIVTYVIKGTLSHKDSMGNSSAINSGDLQRMSAGTGITHSEFNASKTESCHLLQIWFLPQEYNVAPSYEQRPVIIEPNSISLVMDQNGTGDAMHINQDVAIYVGQFDEASAPIAFDSDRNRKLWIQIINGQISINDIVVGSGDGVAITDEEKIALTPLEKSHFLLFDMCP